MAEEKDSWYEYSKLVLKELERLNENSVNMRSDMDSRFNDLSTKLTEFKSTETKVNSQSTWIDKVNDVWSPSQMQQAKDEVYKQKGKWTAAIAIFTFIQIIMGVVFSLIVKFIH